MKFFLSALFAIAGPAVFAGNLLPNGGFEMGTAGWNARRNVAYQDLKKNIPDFQIDSIDRKEGRNSLYLPPSEEKTTWSINSGDFPVETGKVYTASFWVKAEKETKIQFGFYSVPDNRWFVSTRTITLPIGWSKQTFTSRKMAKWAKYALLRVESRGDGPNGGIRFDAFSIVPGSEAKDYAPKQDVELLFLSQNERLAERGKPFTVTIRGGNATNVPATRSGKLVLTDKISGKTVAEVPYSLTIPANGTADRKISVTVEKYGVFALSGKDFAYPFTFGCAMPQHPVTKESRTRFEIGINGLIPLVCESNSISPRGLYPLHLGSLDDALRMFHRAGIRISRMWDDYLFLWELINPAEGVWHWGDVDVVADAAKKAGIQMLPCIGGMSFMRFSGSKYRLLNENWYLFEQAKPAKRKPSFHNGEKNEPMLLPQKVWIEFVRQQAERYRGKISYYEIMNEPNLVLTPDEYTEYLKTAFHTIRKTDPSATVVGICATGDRGGKPGDFIFDCKAAGAMEFCDTVSFHPYSAQLDSSVRDPYDLNRRVRSLAVRKDGTALPVWNSELYYIRPGAPIDSGLNPAKAKHVFRRFLIDLGTGITKSISLHHGTLFGSDLNFAQEPRTFRRAMIPNDVFIAHAAAGAMLNDAVPLKNRIYSRLVNSTAFRHVDGWYGLGIWSIEPDSKVNITLPEGKVPTQVYDCFGNEIPVPKQLTDSAIVIRFNGNEAEFDKWREKIRVNPFCSWRYQGGRIVKDQLFLAFENVASEPLALKIRPVLPGFTASSVTIPANASTELSFKIPQDLPECFECVVFDGKNMTKIEVVPRKKKLAAYGETFEFGGKVSCTATAEKEFLKLVLNVKDAECGKRHPEKIWEGDSVELFFDVKPGYLPDREPYTPFCKRISFARKSANGLDAKLEGMNIDLEKIRWNIRDGKEGYQATLEIPWSALGTTPEAQLGFDVVVNDFDASGKRVAHPVWAGTPDNYKNRTLFGILYTGGTL